MIKWVYIEIYRLVAPACTHRAMGPGEILPVWLGKDAIGCYFPMIRSHVSLRASEENSNSESEIRT